MINLATGKVFRKRLLHGWVLAPGLLLAGCMSADPVGYISPAALAALPEGTDLRTVVRRDDGCYFIQTEDELSGYWIRVRDESGTQVCDPQ
ncbi:hypothetical protein [Actibacterium mucosum]|uniref:hypothetical protein n=1 Tax=Actibacterium mucosum TaxID=1087332 RepID=UPI001268AB6C|nr:hypothetical protein [Actibacterium mucosum]